MSYKYGVDWDWENSLRKGDIDRDPIVTRNLGGARLYASLSPPGSGFLGSAKRVKERINFYRPKLSRPEWSHCFLLNAGEKRTSTLGTEVAMGVTVTNSSSETASETNSFSSTAGFKTDILSCSATSGNEKTNTKTKSSCLQTNQMTTTNKTLERVFENTTNDFVMFWQLTYVVTYHDGATCVYGTSVVMKGEGGVKKPLHTAEYMWKSIME